MNIIEKTNLEIQERCEEIAKDIYEFFTIFADAPEVLNLYAVPRGGIPPSYIISSVLTYRYDMNNVIISEAKSADVVIDDMTDSGNTFKRIKRDAGYARFYSLYIKENKEDWLVFPWESGVESSIEDVVDRTCQLTQKTRKEVREFIES